MQNFYFILKTLDREFIKLLFVDDFDCHLVIRIFLVLSSVYLAKSALAEAFGVDVPLLFKIIEPSFGNRLIDADKLSIVWLIVPRLIIGEAVTLSVSHSFESNLCINK